MQNIYIVLTYTGTVISKMIKGFTKDKFCHSSISLDLELKQMYSFGRFYKYTPLLAGFVHEHIDSGTFKRFNKTVAKVYSLEITDEQYEKIKKIMKDFEKEKSKYKFNFIGMCAAGFDKKIHPKNYFYCAEFIKYVLEEAGIEKQLPRIVKPIHFEQIDGAEEIYTGLLQEYNLKKMDITKTIPEKILEKEGDAVS